MGLNLFSTRVLALASIVIGTTAFLSRPAVAGDATGKPATTLDCRAAQPTAQPLKLNLPLNESDRLGLSYALALSLSSDKGAAWPKSVFGLGVTCNLATFSDAEGEWTIQSSTDGRVPPRWATNPKSSAFAFLAWAPSISDGYAFTRTSPRPSAIEPKTPMLVLVVVRETLRYVVRVYDGVPPIQSLSADMAAGLKGDLPLIATFDPNSSAVSLAVATVSGRRAILPGQLPGEGGPAARLMAPDGDLFVGLDNGDLRMNGSNFVCHANVGDFPLKDMWVSNATIEKRDLSCRFTGPRSWISVFVTRFPTRPSAQSVFDDYHKEALSESGPGESIPPATKAGGPPSPELATAWRHPNDVEEGLWLGQRGPWYVEVRATYAAQDDAAVGKAVDGLYKQVFAEITEP